MRLTPEQQRKYLGWLEKIGRDSCYIKDHPADPSLKKLLNDVNRVGETKVWNTPEEQAFRYKSHPFIHSEIISYSYYQNMSYSTDATIETAQYYGRQVYPKKLMALYRANDLLMDEDIFVSENDLHKMVCETQIDQIGIDCPHYICINLCEIEPERLKFYRDNILDAAMPEMLQNGHIKLLCADSRLAAELGTPELRMIPI
jgi:hypothetical protein